MQPSTPIFPTVLHQQAAEVVNDYFINIPAIDTVLVVNSCARGHAVAESDLDMAILVNAETSIRETELLQNEWCRFARQHATLQAYKQQSPFAHLHVDIISGTYMPITIELAEPIDFFEVEIGNQICYSLPVGNVGTYFKRLQQKWLPYYAEDVRIQRLESIVNACRYDLNHIPYLAERGLHFHAFDVLYNAFQKYLQTLFIANKIYPLAYNKWIKYQLVELLNKPDLYPLLSPVLSIKNIESTEINWKAEMLGELLTNVRPG